MTDLNYSIEGHSVEKIAEYLSMNKLTVIEAINKGAKTYQEIYSYEKQKVCEEHDFNLRIRKKPKSKNSPFGKKYF